MRPKGILTRLQHDEIVAAIQAAEKKNQRRNPRVHTAATKPPIRWPSAQAHLAELGMHKTTERNGVLIFVAPRAHKLRHQRRFRCPRTLRRRILDQGRRRNDHRTSSRRISPPGSFTRSRKPANCSRNIFRASPVIPTNSSDDIAHD